MLDFIGTNWIWILLIGGMLCMHLGHKGHGERRRGPDDTAIKQVSALIGAHVSPNTWTRPEQVGPGLEDGRALRRESSESSTVPRRSGVFTSMHEEGAHCRPVTVSWDPSPKSSWER